MREARNTVMHEIGLRHPIMFDIYDVCSLAREARLPSLKVKMLRHVQTFWVRIQNARYKCSTSCKDGGNDVGVQLLCNLVITSTVNYANVISFLKLCLLYFYYIFYLKWLKSKIYWATHTKRSEFAQWTNLHNRLLR